MPEMALDIALTTMLVQMSSGAEATGASYFDCQRLERECMESVGGMAGAVMPRDNASVFRAFDEGDAWQSLGVFAHAAAALVDISDATRLSTSGVRARQSDG